jgi:hypothetical protein
MSEEIFIWNKSIRPDMLNDELIKELRRQGVIE